MILSIALAVAAGGKPDVSRIHRIVTMGDSITQFGASPKGYVTLVAKDLTMARATSNQASATRPDGPEVEVINAGIGGQKAPDMLARFQKDVVDKHPDLVTLSVGVNDVWHGFMDFQRHVRHPAGDLPAGVPLATYLEDVRKMVEMAKGANIGVVLLSPTLVYEDLDCAENKRMAEYVKAEEGLARREHVGFVNLYKACYDSVYAYQKVAGKRQLLLTVDGVHMNDAGNALIADALLAYLGVPVRNNVEAR